jgi:ubiquinol-cytochrome c reductase cytochrome c1 subunit
MEIATMRWKLGFALGLLLLTGGTAGAAEGTKVPHQSWTFDGVFGTYDRAQLQRGLKVYTGICADCHGLRHVAYRNLVEIGLTPSEAKAVAAKKKVSEIGDDGQPKERPADLKDRFVSPFPNVQAAAAANGGRAPPDLSVIIKARAGGADYCHALLTGYSAPPADWKDQEGRPRTLEGAQQYNKYFPGNVIAMVPPLRNDDQVEYGPGAPKATIDQMARDACAFLAWTAEPKMEERKRIGVKVMLFLLLFTGIFFVIYKRVWRNVH